LELKKLSVIGVTVLVLIGAISLRATAFPAQQSEFNALITTTVTPSPSPSPTPTATISPTPCPVTTQEPLWVDPVTSPTDLLTQTIGIYAGNTEWITITTGYDVFTATGPVYPAGMVIDLQLKQIHHLEVFSRVRVIKQGECVYGGYTLKTRYDRYGGLLEIIQLAHVQYLPALLR
jgi:hypothetical protein